jgi:hypothetical protein
LSAGSPRIGGNHAARSRPQHASGSTCFAYLGLLDFHDSYGLLDHLSSDGFNYWSDRPRGFLHWARLGLAFAAVRFAALATLRALPRLAEFALLARLCTFDPFFRLAKTAPVLVAASTSALMQSGQAPGNLSNELSPDFSLRAT